MAESPKRIREDDLDRLGREAFINLYLASDRFRSGVERLCKEEGLAMSHYTVLWFLAHKHAPEGVPMGAVIDGHLNRASDATRLADRLCDLGFLERLASPSDRRVVLVRLTEAGREVFVRLTRRVKDLHREQWKPLTEKELETLNRLLTKVLWGDDAKSGAAHPLVTATARKASRAPS
jgi:DNA-binding MarR family transcriptional regulator